MGKLLICVVIGYLLGCINPAYLISKMKDKDITNRGTGNLGTTNAFINFGKVYGVLVLICDMGKAVLAVVVSRYLYPDFLLGGIVAGSMAVIGHILPFYNGFMGGKGVASFGGLVLISDWKLFLLLLAVGCIAALFFNYGCSISFTAAILFPVLYGVKTGNILVFLVLVLCSILLMYKHLENLRKIKEGAEPPIREFLYTHIMGGSLHGTGK